MGYHVKIDELCTVRTTIRSQIKQWETQLQEVQGALISVENTRAISGETGEHIRSYIAEVHKPLLQAIVQMMEEYEMRLAIYIDGYAGIDESATAEISQDLLENQQQLLQNEQRQFESLSEELREVLSSVDDIIRITLPNTDSVKSMFALMESEVSQLNTNTGEYEELHKRDTQTVDEMLETIESILASRRGAGVSATSYIQGSYVMNPAYHKLKKQMGVSTKYTGDYRDAYGRAVSNEEKIQVDNNIR